MYISPHQRYVYPHHQQTYLTTSDIRMTAGTKKHSPCDHRVVQGECSDVAARTTYLFL